MRNSLNGSLTRFAILFAILFCRETVLAEDGVGATRETVLAYVITGDRLTDQLSEAGLRSLSQILSERTTIDPEQPIGVDLESSEIGYFPFLYWPVLAEQGILTAQSVERVNRYLSQGGMILFDTKDAGLSGFGVGTANSESLRQLSEMIQIPALEPLSPNHVLSRSFYLIDEYPGRYPGAVWVEAGRGDPANPGNLLLGNSNDSVTPVVIGGNDWVSAWAMSTEGTPLFPVEPSSVGERTREFAYRFGVNLIMHALTGNYKSDQQHIEVLLKRLGI